MPTGTPIRLPRGALPRLRRADPKMAAVIDAVGRCRMRKGQARCDLESLMRAIVYQQLSGKAAQTIYGRVMELLECGPDAPFPAPEQIVRCHHARLRKAGLSRQKQAAVKDLCRHVIDGRLPLGDLSDLHDDTLIERLTAVRGIGRWSAQMFMMFHLGRLDVWPVDDLGVQKGVAKMRGLAERPKPKQMVSLGEPFAPYRSIAAWYMWRFIDGDAQI